MESSVKSENQLTATDNISDVSKNQIYVELINCLISNRALFCKRVFDNDYTFNFLVGFMEYLDNCELDISKYNKTYTDSFRAEAEDRAKEKIVSYLQKYHNHASYKIMNGEFEDGVSNKNPINLIPSQEFIHALTNLMIFFKIKNIEQYRSGNGLFAYFMDRYITENKLNISYIASDDGNYPFTSGCIPIIYHKIVKKSSCQLKQYSKFNLILPDAVLIVQQPLDGTNDDTYFSDLIASVKENVSYIFLLVPVTNSKIYQLIYNVIHDTGDKYIHLNYFAKAVTKFFKITKLYEKYPSDMVLHLIIKTESIDIQKIENIIAEGIFPNKIVGHGSGLYKQIQYACQFISPETILESYGEMIKNIVPVKCKELKSAQKFLVKNNIKMLPNVIKTHDDFVFWLRIADSLHILIWMDDYEKYIHLKNIIDDLPLLQCVTASKERLPMMINEITKMYGLPKWINKLNDLFYYFYMSCDGMTDINDQNRFTQNKKMLQKRSEKYVLFINKND